MSIRQKLNQVSNSKKSTWSKDADYRIKNRKWLRYSSNIARRILVALQDSADINQSRLAELIDVSPQYISKIIKGSENLTLETIAKLSEALKVELIVFPEYRLSNPITFKASLNADTVYIMFARQSTPYAENIVPHNTWHLSVEDASPFVC